MVPVLGRPSGSSETETSTVVFSASVDSEPTFQHLETETRSASFSPGVSGGPEGSLAATSPPPAMAAAKASSIAEDWSSCGEGGVAGVVCATSAGAVCATGLWGRVLGRTEVTGAVTGGAGSASSLSLQEVVSWRLHADGTILGQLVDEKNIVSTPILPGDSCLYSAQLDKNFMYFFQHHIANKIKSCVYQQSQYRELIIEGIISIADGENPRSIEVKLGSYLP